MVSGETDGCDLGELFAPKPLAGPGKGLVFAVREPQSSVHLPAEDLVSRSRH
jgi:hypothetical protein